MPGAAIHESNDARLMARIRAGEDEGMAELYDRYSQIVYSVALRVLGDPGGAEDVLQDVFIQLWRNPLLYDPSRGNLGAWLAVIARNRSIDRLRKRKPETELDDFTAFLEVPATNKAEQNIFLSKVRNMMADLPGDQRSALEMAFFEGLTHSEIAAKTGVALGTIKTRVRTALTTLRKRLT